jgi:L-cysteine:1D-myo-inositol 2-amino-2-deoxy-alpha-D-glucopyranoside ligase
VSIGTHPEVRMYVCGITPYDAAHLGHAATYVAFDVLRRTLEDAGHRVRHVQNVTDVDDPLLERAKETDEDWADLAGRQTALFGEQMAALNVIPPEAYPTVSETIGPIADVVRRLLAVGAAYPVSGDGAGPDVYFDLAADPSFGSVSRLDRGSMAALFAETGGDPERPGKRSRLDPVLWRSARPGEPAWPADGLPSGRPGWHVECAAIVVDRLGMGFDVQGGGSDLVFPHHEMGASLGRVLTGEAEYARAYVHAGLVGLDGAKMSKSKGNLVFVHEAVAAGLEPAALRIALLAHRYRDDWSWSEDEGRSAAARLERWRAALALRTGPQATPVVEGVRRALADDLDTPGALAVVDAWASAQLSAGGTDPLAPALVAAALDSLLGVRTARG